jgi:hypothetical protein
VAKKSADSGSPSRLAALRRGAWLFPVVLLVIVLILALFRVSGSSVGYYNQLFGTGHDANLLYGQPRAVRSDEWLVTTPMTVAQWRSGFSSTNEKIGDGVDMAAIFDVPYRDWSALFRPQNLSFFVLPLENAFAFKWWLLGGALAAAVYFLTLTLLPGRKVLAALLGLGLLLSPFVHDTGSALRALTTRQSPADKSTDRGGDGLHTDLLRTDPLSAVSDTLRDRRGRARTRPLA